jgi:UDP-N-acetylmuramoyl-tripeptide--D-alanyl-D-alanine ligase
VELTLRDMAKMLGASIEGARPLHSARRRVDICIDTRRLRKGQVYWALRGENFDGHAFVEQAFKTGGGAAVVERDWFETNGRPERVYVPVGDTREALTALARSYATRFRIPKVAVTGSNGKTTTKEMIAAVLRRAGRVLATEGNLNNQVGLPLTLFGLRAQHRYAVLELGMSRPGEIRELSGTARPTMAVVTNIGDAHLENFGTRAAIRDEKLSVIAGFPGGKGVLFLNVDDPLLLGFRPPAGVRLATFGVHRGNVRAADLALDAEGRASFRVGRTEFRLPLPGAHNVYNALAAVAVGMHLRVPKADIAAALATFNVPGNRMLVRRFHGVTVLDDCYNANPSSVRAALDTLAARETRGRRVAVLGDMLELGAEGERLHAEAGRYVAEAGVDALYTFGPLSRHLHQAARAKGLSRASARHYADLDELSRDLAATLAPGDTVLVKGSRGMRLERVQENLREAFRSGSRIAE